MNASTTEIAVDCLRANLSVVPIRTGTKLPDVPWKPLQSKRMTKNEANQVFVNGCNIALVGGAVSGNLEALDFDKSELFQPFLDTLESINADLRVKLRVHQSTPSGGFHILYRCTCAVGGNMKLAMSARYQDEAGKPRQDVFIETRGEGGYFLIAPSVVSPGKSYTLHGSLADLPVLSPEEHEVLLSLARSFDEGGQQAPQPPAGIESVTGDRPGDRFNRDNDWRQLLECEGWTFVKTVGKQQHWSRPGKTDGTTSATLNGQGLFCFSSSTPLPTQKPIDKFAFYTYYQFNGDFKAAAQSLKNSANSANSAFSANSAQLSQNQPSSASVSQHSAISVKTIGDDRSISKNVLSFIDSDPAPFAINDLYLELCARTLGEKKSIRNALQYQEKIGKISKIEGRRGHFEITEEEPASMDLLSASVDPYSILLPLDISKKVQVRPGSIILISGSTNAGKTVFLLNIVRNFLSSPTYVHTDLPLSNKLERKGLPPLVYLNSEMSSGELATRIKGFGEEPSSWVPYVKFIERTHSFDKLVDPDGVTFIDYLEVNEDFFNAGKFLADIHRKLQGGVAVVAMQKKQGNDYAKGGEMVNEKPRLVINLDKNEPHGFICKIAKAKEPVDFMHTIQGMERDYVISGLSEILPTSDWRFVKEPQRKQINQDYCRTNLPNRAKRDRIDYRTGEPLFMATPAPIYAEEGAL